MMPDGIPPDIDEQVRAAERRRALGVKLCVLAGVCLLGAGLALYMLTPHHTATPTIALVLIGAGLATAFPLAAVLALLLGPTWQQRQRHWQSLHHRRWR